MVDTAFEQAYSAASRVAAVRAANIVALNGLPHDDRQDLTQEALLELWRKSPMFDARRASWRTFAERVVANRMTSLMRNLHSARYGHGKGEPLSMGRFLPGPDHNFDLQIEVRSVLAGMTQFDQDVAQSLIDHSAVETGHRLGVSRATVYRAMGRLRIGLTEAGLSPPGRGSGRHGTRGAGE